MSHREDPTELNYTLDRIHDWNDLVPRDHHYIRRQPFKPNSLAKLTHLVRRGEQKQRERKRERYGRIHK